MTWVRKCSNWVQNDQNISKLEYKSRYEMTKLNWKRPNWVRNDQNANKSGYEIIKMVQNDMGTK